MSSYRSIVLFFLLAASGLSHAQTASFSADSTSGCAPFTVNFTNNSTGATSYLWEFGDGLTSTQTSPSHTYWVTGDSIEVWLFAFQGASVDSTSITLEIPQFAPYFNLPTEACPGEVVQFYANNAEPSNQVSWDMDDGYFTQGQFVQHTYSNPGLYNVVMTVNTNSVCGVLQDSATIDINTSVVPDVHVHNYPLVNDPNEICVGENFPFFYDETLSVFWDFGDGNTSNDPYPVHSYSSAGQYLATITVTNQCGVSSSIDTLITVTNGVQPIAAVFANHQKACPGEDVTFWGTPGFDMTYQWSFNDGFNATGQYITRSFSTAGWYTATLVVSNLCGNSDTTNYAFEVDSTLVPSSILYISDDLVCPGEELTFLGSSGLESYSWDLGDGNTDTNRVFTHSYGAPGTYYVQLEVTNVCGVTSTYMDSVTVTDTLIGSAPYLTANQTLVCPGTQVTILWNQSNQVQSVDWVVDDTVLMSGNDTLLYSFDSLGTHTIKGFGTNFCGDIDSAIITIQVDSGSYPVANYSYTSGFLCPNDPVQFNNMSSDTLNTMWVFGTGDTAYGNNPLYTFPQPGNYLVQLSVENQCGNEGTYSSLVALSASNEVSGQIQPSDSVFTCPGVPLNLNVDQLNGTPTWKWGQDTYSGTMFTLNEPSPTNGYVHLNVQNSCGALNDSVFVSVLDTLPAPTVFCADLGDTIRYEWLTNNAAYYEISVDGGVTWSITTQPNILIPESWINGVGMMVSHGEAECMRSDTSFFTCSLDGIVGLSIGSFLVYPNPANDEVNIQLTQGSQNGHLSIFDISGKQIMSTTFNSSFFSVDVSSIDPGIYLIGIKVDGVQQFSRIVIQ